VRRRGPRDYCAAAAETVVVFAAVLHLSSSAALNARPSTAKLSMRPARLASDWQRTAGRLSAVAPWQAAGPHVQVMSRAMNRSLVGTAGLAE